MKRFPILSILILFVSLAARLWRLEFQSLWWDEGVSIYLSGAGLRALTIDKDFGIDLHPPGYHLGLALWRDLLGPAVFADRLLSVFGGVLTVALTYAFTRLVCRRCSRSDERLKLNPDSSDGDRAVNFRAAPVIAALFAAISPIDVFYSQEIRMYAFLPVLGLLSLIATIRLLPNGRPGAWIVWILVNLAGWYVYYYLALLSVSESLCLLLVAFGIVGRGRARLHWLAWLGANLALGIGYVPWLAVIAQRAVGTSLALPPETETHLSPVELLLDVGRSFTLGFISPPAGTLLLFVWLILALAGAILVARRNPTVAILLILSAVIPIAGAGAILLARPFFYPRFILFVVGPLWALTAIGLTSVSRSWVVRTALILPLVAGNGSTWLTERTTARTGYSSADYRAVFDSLAPLIQTGDVFLGGYPWEAGYAEAYFWRLAPRAVYVRRGTEVATIDRLAGSANRLWVLTYDPDRHFGPDPLENAAATGRATLAIDQNGDSRLRLFAGGSAPPPMVAPGAATFDGEISLGNTPADLAGKRHPGDVVEISMRWQALRKPGSDDTVFVHLVGPDGKLWGQHDAPPLGGAFPTGSWSVGEVVIDRHVIPIAVGAPPGQYQIEVGLYQPDTGRRLTVGPRPTTDNRVVIGTFVVSGE